MQFYPQTKEVSGANSISTYYNRIYTDNQQQIEQDGFVKIHIPHALMKKPEGYLQQIISVVKNNPPKKINNGLILSVSDEEPVQKTLAEHTVYSTTTKFDKELEATPEDSFNRYFMTKCQKSYKYAADWIPPDPYSSKISLNSLAENFKKSGINVDGITDCSGFSACEQAPFGCHREMHFVGSANVLIWGAHKDWCIIKPCSHKKLETIGPKLFGKHWNCPVLKNRPCKDPFAHFSIWPSLTTLKKEGIQYTLVRQQPTQLIITSPLAFHFGISAGPNFCEAVAVSCGNVGKHFNISRECPRHSWTVTPEQHKRFKVEDVNYQRRQKTRHTKRKSYHKHKIYWNQKTYSTSTKGQEKRRAYEAARKKKYRQKKKEEEHLEQK